MFGSADRMVRGFRYRRIMCAEYTLVWSQSEIFLVHLFHSFISSMSFVLIQAELKINNKNLFVHETASGHVPPRLAVVALQSLGPCVRYRNGVSSAWLLTR